MPEAVEIASGPLVARFAPWMGGRMTEFFHRDYGAVVAPIVGRRFDPLDWPRAGAYPLFPFHNRLVGAAFQHEGKRYQVRPHPSLAGDAIHGPSHRRAWRITSHNPTELGMAIDYAADEDWPFSFTAEQAFRLSPDGLTVVLRITNRDAGAAPCGFGWHPYFAASVDKRACTDARYALPLNDLALPTGKAGRLREEQLVPADTGYTIHLTDWTSADASLDCRLAVRLAAEDRFSHLAVHRMTNYLCLEPVSHAANALALDDDSRLSAGMVTLQPGEVLSGEISVILTM